MSKHMMLITIYEIVKWLNVNKTEHASFSIHDSILLCHEELTSTICYLLHLAMYAFHTQFYLQTQLRFYKRWVLLEVIIVRCVKDQCNCMAFYCRLFLTINVDLFFLYIYTQLHSILVWFQHTYVKLLKRI